MKSLNYFIAHICYKSGIVINIPLVKLEKNGGQWIWQSVPPKSLDAILTKHPGSVGVVMLMGVDNIESVFATHHSIELPESFL